MAEGRLQTVSAAGTQAGAAQLQRGPGAWLHSAAFRLRPVLVRVMISQLTAMSRRVVGWSVWEPTALEGLGRSLSRMPLLSSAGVFLAAGGSQFPEASLPGTRPSASDSYAPMRRELRHNGGSTWRSPCSGWSDMPLRTGGTVTPWCGSGQSAR